MDVAAYKEFLNQPWGKLYYEILFAQLAHIKNKKVLDFGVVLVWWRIFWHKTIR